MWEIIGEHKHKKIQLKQGGLNLLKHKMIKQNKERTIYIPCKESKKFYRNLLPYLENIFDSHKKADISHGFIKGRSPVSNAKKHLNFHTTISFDITNFFENITPSMIAKYLPNKIIEVCFINDFLPQGLPTSPIISNISMISVDLELLNILKQFVKSELIKDFALTRYADDITISFNLICDCQKCADFESKYYSDIPISEKTWSISFESERKKVQKQLNACRQNSHSESFEIFRKISITLSELLLEYGLSINKRKTRYQHISNGNKIITGVSISKKGIRASRTTMRKFRAALHQINVDSSLGLNNWIELVKRQS